MLQTIERKTDARAEEARRLAEAKAAIDRRLALGAAPAKTEAKATEAPLPEARIAPAPRWARLNAGRATGRDYIGSERIFTRREIRLAALACGAYILAVAAIGLFSILEHRPNISPVRPGTPDVSGAVEATELPPLPADGAGGG
jgi:hypothetical protein